jgi:hypothetical protein
VEFWRCLTAFIEGSASLKGLHDGAGVADAKVKGLLFDVESFAQVLYTIKDILDQEKAQSSLQATGHILRVFY